MLPVITIIGRPNVGKSTLFNRLTRTKAALISSHPGMTRDRQYGTVNWLDRRCLIIDTGGISSNSDELNQLIIEQVEVAIADCDQIILVVDGSASLTSEDLALATKLRRGDKPITIAVNKTEGLDPNFSLNDAFSLGLGTPLPISAMHGHGIDQLITHLFPAPDSTNPASANSDEAPDSALPTIKLAIVGRPNVGKSTLANRILQETRLIVHDAPGTTRDSIYIPFERFGHHYTLIDTAGVRRRSKITDVPEKFSVIKTMQAIEDANVVFFVIDARAGVAQQDLKLLSFILECGKSLVIALNKWDGMDETTRTHAKTTIDRHLEFVSFARIHYISALHGSGVGNLFKSALLAYTSAQKKLTTPLLNRLLQQAQTTHQPPLVHGHRVKMRYAHSGGNNPPRIIIHGNQLDALPNSYRKFLANFFQAKLELVGTPVLIEFKTNANPFAD